MVDPARILHRIERFEFVPDDDPPAVSCWVDIYIDGDPRWYLGFTFDERKFYLHRKLYDLDDPREVQMEGRLRDYLVSILPDDIKAKCVAAALVATAT